MGEIKSKECVVCGGDLVGRQVKYCSTRCNSECHNSKRSKKYDNCENCGIPLKKRKKKYCSKQCQIIDYSNKEYSKKYYQKHKKKMKKQKKEYRKNNKDEIKKSSKIYRENHKEQIKKSNKEYSSNNREKINKQIKKWRLKNIKEVRKKTNKYVNKKYKENLIFKLNTLMSASISQSLKDRNLSKNGKHWETLIIDNLQEIMEHLEKNFLPGMSWKNHGRGGWHIDHIIPVTFFKFTNTNDVEFKYLWSIDNLQPLWEKDNEEKNDKVMLWGKEIRARDIDIYTNAI